MELIKFVRGKRTRIQFLYDGKESIFNKIPR